ncbi:hypothetical protein KIN20_033738, partial [Parelaphostrongylus tenuis]
MNRGPCARRRSPLTTSPYVLLFIYILVIVPNFAVCPSDEKLFGVALSEDIESISDHCNITPDAPLRPMIAHPTKGINEIMRRFRGSQFACELKYGGKRGHV